MAEAVGAPASGTRPAEADNGILLWAGLGIAVVLLLVLVPWSILAAVALGVIGILWVFSKGDAAAAAKETSSAEGAANTEASSQQDGDLHLPPPRSAKTVNGLSTSATGAHADAFEPEDTSFSTYEGTSLLASAATIGSPRNRSTSTVLPGVVSNDSQRVGRASLGLLHSASGDTEGAAHFQATRASVVQFSNAGEATEASGASIYKPHAEAPLHSALYSEKKPAPPPAAGAASVPGAAEATAVSGAAAAAAAAAEASAASKAAAVEASPAAPSAPAAAAALTGSAAILAKLRAQRGSSAGAASATSRPSSATAAAGASTSPPKVVFLYGSQTGTGQEIAKSLHAEACSRGIPADVMSMNELGLANCTKDKTPIVVMVASSTGDGDPPDNCAAFYVGVKKNQQAKDLMQGVHYTVLGLGDSNYTRFMYVSRALKNRFAELGGSCFYPCAEADEVDGLEATVDPWVEGIWGPIQELSKKLMGGGKEAAAGAAAAGGVGTEAASAGAADGGKEAAAGVVGLSEESSGVLGVELPYARSGTSNSLIGAITHEPSEGAVLGGGLVAMELSEGSTGGQLSGRASLLGEEVSANSLPTAPAAAAGGTATPAKRPASAATATPVSLINGRAPEGVELTGVPALPPCRVELELDVAPEVVAAVRAKERQRPDPEAAVHRDAGGQYSVGQPFWAPVVDARLLTAPWSDRRVIHLELDVSDSAISYQPGDAIGMLPLNDPVLVDAVLQRLDVDGSTVFQPKPAGAAGGGGGGSSAGLLSHLPWPCSLRVAFSCGVDLTGPARKSLLRVLAEYCSDADEQRTLLFMCSKAGKEAYSQEIVAGSPSLLDLLQRFPSCSPPLGHLLDVLQPLAPRMYSLTTSPLEHPKTIQFAFSTVTFPSKYGTRKGVATHWLERMLQPWLQAQEVAGPRPAKEVLLPLYLRPAGHFRPPEDVTMPLLMIGPGTGVAPFRGFLQQRRQQMKAAPNAFPGASWLYFGCRREDEDYLYREDWEEFLEEGVLLQMRTAFSRAQEEKVYVQQLMAQDAAALAQLIAGGGYVYVCGDGAGMAKDVHAALVEILVKEGGVENEAAAAAQLQAMAKEGRYVRDIWC